MARALAVEYGDEIAERWARMAAQSDDLAVEPLVGRMFDVVLSFLEDRPAFLPLLGASADYQHDPAARDRLRGDIAVLLRRHQPALAQAEAVRVAHVTVQIIKGMSLLFAGQPAVERQALTAEFKLALTAYLSARLAGR